MKFPMEICSLNADDPRRVWQPGEEPAASPARPQDDAGGSRRAERCPRHRGQPHRERQARPPSVDGAEAGGSRWPQCKRSAPLSIRPASVSFSVTGDRPLSGCLVLLQYLQQRHNLANRLDLHPDHLPPARQRPVVYRGGRERVRNFLVLGNQLVSQAHVKSNMLG